MITRPLLLLLFFLLALLCSSSPIPKLEDSKTDRINWRHNFKNKSVAICLVGQIRGFKYPEVVQQMINSLIQPFEDNGFDVDIGFIVSEDPWTKKSNIFDHATNRGVIWYKPDPLMKISPYKQKLKLCAQSLLRSPDYQYIIFARVDLLYLSPLNITQIKRGFIHSRVRATYQVDNDYSRRIPSTCIIPNLRPLFVDTVSAWTRDLPIPPKEDRNMTLFNWGSTHPKETCKILPDDQFFLFDGGNTTILNLLATLEEIPKFEEKNEDPCFCDNLWEESKLLSVWNKAGALLRIIDLDVRVIFPGCTEPPFEERWYCFKTQKQHRCFYPSCVPGAYYNTRFV
jgi:hypothetical protein